jgi:hypothetical protein
MAAVITSLSESQGNIGDQITIVGTGFGATQSTSTVSFTTVNGTVNVLIYVSWSATAIVVVVPFSTVTGGVVVTVGGVSSNSVTFTVIGLAQGAIYPYSPYSQMELHGFYDSSVCQRTDIEYTITSEDVAAVAANSGFQILQFNFIWPIPFQTKHHYAVMVDFEIIFLQGGEINAYQYGIPTANKTEFGTSVFMYAFTGCVAGDIIIIHCLGFCD